LHDLINPIDARAGQPLGLPLKMGMTV